MQCDPHIESLGYRTTIGESKIRFEPKDDRPSELCVCTGYGTVCEDHATHSVTPDDLALFVGTGRWQQTCVAVPYRNESGRQRAKVWDGAVLS